MIKTYNERRLWVLNNEWLYLNYIDSKKSISVFIKENREFIDSVIKKELGEK